MAKKSLGSLQRCEECGVDKISMEFYSYNGRTFEVFPVCKKCLNRIFNKMLEGYKGDYFMALIHLCCMMDIPFNLEDAKLLYNHTSPMESFAGYLNSMLRADCKKSFVSTSPESLFDILSYCKGNQVESSGYNKDVENFTVTKEMYTRWGTKFSKADIYYLENIYNELVESYGGTQPTEKSLYRDYAINELMKNQAREEGKDDLYMKFQTAQSKLMADARLKPAQEKDTNTDDYLVGMFIKNIEENRPVAEVSEKYKDVDGIHKIIQEEYIDKLSRSIGGVLK